MTANPSTLDVRGVLIPLEGNRLLLPNVTIVEIVGFRSPEPYDNAPGWLLGEMQWHNRRFPLVSFEQAVGEQEVTPGHRARIVICHTLREDPEGIPYIGVVSKAVPRLVRLRVENIFPNTDDEHDSNPLILRRVNVSEQDAIIPDLDALEDMIGASLNG